MNKFRPAYLRSYKEGTLHSRIAQVENIITDCTLCPHQCHVDRRNSNEGKCRSGYLPAIASYGPHHGEEPPLVGFYGSGTIFFTGCNLKCIFCQNFEISQGNQGHEISHEALASIMIELQQHGCHNINFVTPTHMVHAILHSLPLAIEKGLSIPLVYNSGGYDSIETIRLLDGIFDIYMPDFKYFNNDSAKRLSGIPGYAHIAVPAISEMHRQVGDLVVDISGIAIRGMIIRHLVLPGGLEDTFKIIDFVSKLSNNTYLNLMDQYRPAFKAASIPEINKRITGKEFTATYDYAVSKGLTRIAK